MTISQDLKKSSVESPYIEMIRVDGSTIDQSILFNWTQSSDMSFQFGGVTYEPFPYQITGAEVTTGQAPRPKLTLSNVTKVVQPFIQRFQGLKGVKVMRIRTLAKYLDNGPSADSSQTLPIEVFYVNAMTRMDRSTVEFELVTEMDLPHAKLPAAQALKDDLGTNDLYAPGLSIIRFRG